MAQPGLHWHGHRLPRRMDWLRPEDDRFMPPLLLPYLIAFTGALESPAGADSFAAGGIQTDSTEIVTRARELQESFERFRESRIPVSTHRGDGGCDERIGRICIWYGGAGELDFPPEPVETSMSRGELIGALYDAADEVRDPWVTGQLVHYLAEGGRLQEAESAARRCDLADGWWCDALLGYVLHLRGSFTAAEEAFRSALAALPPVEEDTWRLPRFVLSNAGLRTLDAGGQGGDERLELFWRLSNPLFLIEGNDRWTEHYARLVEVRNQENAANPYDIQWDEDMAETLVRYGRNIGWSRVSQPSSPFGGGGGVRLQDSRRVTGHHHPASRGYLFPEQFLAAPADVPPESWITAPREARTWYAPPYAPDFRALETQVARFRTDDGVLVVAAYRPEAPERDHLAAVAPPPADEPWDPFARSAPPAADDRQPGPSAVGLQTRGPVRSGLFLVPEDGGELLSVTGEEEEGVLVLEGPPGRYISSIELLEPSEGRAWRARQGVVQGSLTRGLVAVSDLLLLREDAPLPETLDEALALARPGIRISREERFSIVWEVYGLQVEEEVRVTLGFTQGRPGFLTRVGEFLGVLQPDRPVEVTFADAGPDEVSTLFRAVQLTLPDLDPGDYTLHLRLEMAGREPAVASRPITVEP
jgi:hypothetical protein